MDFNHVAKRVERKGISGSKTVSREINEFNFQGQLLKTTTYFTKEDGSFYLSRVQETTYTSDGKKQSEHNLIPDEAHRTDKLVLFEYDSQRKLIKSTQKGIDYGHEIDYYTIYEYSSKGEKTGKRYETKSDRLYEIEHYNSDNQLMQTDVFDCGKKIDLTKCWKYDAEGHVIEELWKHEDSEWSRKMNYRCGFFFPLYRYEYDSEGNKIAEYSYREDGEIFRESHFTYNEEHNELSVWRKTRLREKLFESHVTYEYTIVYEESGTIAERNIHSQH